MAVACARCGAQNPDGNAFCQACGSPLAAGAPQPAPPAPSAPPAGPPPGPPAGVAGPPAGMPPPVFAGPSAYASPYFTPQPAMAPIHRTPGTLIIAGVVAVVVLIAGCGTAVAVLARRRTEPRASRGGCASQRPALRNRARRRRRCSSARTTAAASTTLRS